MLHLKILLFFLLQITHGGPNKKAGYFKFIAKFIYNSDEGYLVDQTVGRSLLVISPDVLSIILLSDRLCTRSITFGDFTRCALYNSTFR